MTSGCGQCAHLRACTHGSHSRVREDDDCVYFICHRERGEAVGTIRLYLPRAKVRNILCYTRHCLSVLSHDSSEEWQSERLSAGRDSALREALFEHMRSLGGTEVIADAEVSRIFLYLIFQPLSKRNEEV